MFGITLDKKSIELLLNDFNTITGVRIAFYSHNLQESIAVPKDSCSFCSVLRMDKSAEQQCRNCDKYAFESAVKQGGLYLYECHAGLTEGVTPIIVENKILGYLMLGQTLKQLPDQNLWEKVYLKCKDYDVDFHSLKEAFFKLSYVQWEKLYAAARIMDQSAKFIYLSKFIKIQAPTTIKKIENYVEENLNQSITISLISQSLNISKSHLSHLIKQEYNKSLTRYIQDKKIQKAIEYLEKTEISVSKVSELLGFSDPNYFSRIFKKITGVSASEYRISSKKKA